MKLSRSLLDAALLPALLGATSPAGAAAAGSSLRAATGAAEAEDFFDRAGRERREHYERHNRNVNEKCHTATSPDFDPSFPECEVREGTYLDPYGEELDWWAFIPTDCPEGGCPLFFATDGTGNEFFNPPDQQTWMIEMVSRGFAAVTMGYANSMGDFGFCYGQPDSLLRRIARGTTPLSKLPQAEFGLVQKAQHIFDPSIEGSIMQQACDGPEAFANCELGVAAAGVSQGAVLSALGSNFDKRISALLLWAVGDNVQVIRDFVPGGLLPDTGDHFTDWALPCMDNIQLPPVRRRMISGDEDRFFGRDGEGTLEQYKRMIGGYYDCGDNRDCLTRAPASVVDAYTGSSIADEGGYHLVEGTHTSWIRCQCLGNGTICHTISKEAEDACDEPSPYFENEGIEGGPASFDWLARTAQIPYDGNTASSEEVTLEVDLDHWRLIDTQTEHGFFVEWADVNGAFGQRKMIGEGELAVTHVFPTIPDDTPGFRLSAASFDSAFIDQLEAFTIETIARRFWSYEQRTIFRGMKFGENRGDGWCLSLGFLLSPPHFLGSCVNGALYSCIDFCADGGVHFCDLNNVSSCVAETKLLDNNDDGDEFDGDNSDETAAAAAE